MVQHVRIRFGIQPGVKSAPFLRVRMPSAIPALLRRLLVALLALLLSGMMPTAMQVSAQGSAAPTVLVHSDPVHLRDGPGTHHQSIVLLQSGSICAILGRSPDGWWNVNCQGYKPGWVRQDVVLPQGNTNVVPLLGAPPASGTLPQTSTPSSTAVSASVDSSFDAVVLRKEYNFGAAENARLKPGDSCPVRGRQLGGGEWWYVQCPDGRAGWASGAFVTIVGSRSSVPSSGTLDTGWHSHFYPNTKNPAIQSSTSAMIPGSDFELSFNWGAGASEAGVDNWAARFVRTLNMAPGPYVISANADDGVRVYLDGKRIIDEWTEGSFDSRPRTFTAPLNGVHTIAVDYFDATGNAALRVRITPQTGTASVPAPAVPIASRLSVIENTWRAQYFSGASPGGVPAYEEYVYLPPPTDGSRLNQNWGYASPPGIANTDYFSAIFEGKFYFEDGDYGFMTQSDDGSRVLINGMPVIEKWRVGNDRATNNFARIQAGWHTIRVEYFEETGLASATLWFWFKGFYGCISAGHCPQ